MRLLKQTGRSAVAFMQRVAYRLMVKHQVALAEARTSGSEDGISLTRPSLLITHHSLLSSDRVKPTTKSAKIEVQLLLDSCEIWGRVAIREWESLWSLRSMTITRLFGKRQSARWLSLVMRAPCQVLLRHHAQRMCG